MPSDTALAGTVKRDEVEEAFRHYFMTGPVYEDWGAWSRLFIDDALYTDHYFGTFTGPPEIERFLEGTMSFASHVYSPLVWYNIDGTRVVYQVVNRADDPADPDGEPIDFSSLQIIEYAGDGKWSSENDWWLVADMKLFNQRYTARLRLAESAGTGAKEGTRLSRKNWGSWVDWARPATDEPAAPSWLGRDIPPIKRLSDFTFGQRIPHPA